MTANNGAAPGQESGPAKTPTLTKTPESSPRLLRTPVDSGAVTAAAHQAALRGRRVLAVHTVDGQGRCTCGKASCAPAGKHPVKAGWQNTPPMSGADIQATWEERPYNLGLATGAPSGFWVLDVDLDKPGTAERWNEARAGRTLPATCTVRTPGGWHHYFAMPDFNVTNSAKRLPDGVDVRGTGGMVVAPPSVSGKGAYKVATEAPDWSEGVADEIASAPAWLLELVRPLPPAAPVDLATVPKLTDLPPAEQRRLRAYTDRVVHAELERLDECKRLGWHGPGWNTTTFEVSCTLIELAHSPWCPLTPQEAHALVLERAPTDAGFTDADVEGCFASALKTVAGKGRALPVASSRGPVGGPVYPGDPLSDPDAPVTPSEPPATSTADGEDVLTSRRQHIRTHSDQAARVARDVLAGRWRWTRQLGWFRFDGKRWAETSPEVARHVVMNHLRRYVEDHQQAIFAAARTEQRPLTDEDLAEIASLNRMLAKVFLDAVTALAGPLVGIEPTEFDAHPELLNCGNGVLNLRTGELGPHDPRLYLRKITPVSYRPEALQHPDLARILGCVPDQDTLAWLQVRFGQAATGYVPPDDRLLLLQGGGSNGKSTMTGLAMASLGEYAISVDDKVLLAEDNSHSTERMDLFGARFGLVEEVPGGRELDTNKIKKIVGTPKLKARRMRMDPVEWSPTHALFVTTNTTPIVRATDHGAWRRLLRVNFPIRYREPGQPLELPQDRPGDTALRAKVEAGDPALTGAFLAWLVAGATRWFAADRVMPPVPAQVLVDTAAWRTETDLTYQFLASQMVPDRGRHVLVADFYERYTKWAESEHQRPLAKNSFSTKVREHPLWTKHGLGDATVRNHVTPSLLSRPDPHAVPLTSVARVVTGLRFRYADDDEEGAS